MLVYGDQGPHFVITATGEDRPPLLDLRDSIGSLCNQVNRFYAALELVEWCDKRITPIPGEDTFRAIAWKTIAGREGAMRVSDFRDALQGANGALKKAVGDSGIVKVSPSPDDLLQRYFPNIATVRNSAAHSALPDKNEKQRKAHQFPGDFANQNLIITNAPGISLTDVSINGDYFGTFNGEIGSVAMTRETLDQLEEIKLAFLRKIPRSLGK